MSSERPAAYVVTSCSHSLQNLTGNRGATQDKPGTCWPSLDKGAFSHDKKPGPGATGPDTNRSGWRNLQEKPAANHGHHLRLRTSQDRVVPSDRVKRENVWSQRAKIGNTGSGGAKQDMGAMVKQGNWAGHLAKQESVTPPYHVSSQEHLTPWLDFQGHFVSPYGYPYAQLVGPFGYGPYGVAEGGRVFANLHRVQHDAASRQGPSFAAGGPSQADVSMERGSSHGASSGHLQSLLTLDLPETLKKQVENLPKSNVASLGQGYSSDPSMAPAMHPAPPKEPQFLIPVPPAHGNAQDYLKSLITEMVALSKKQPDSPRKTQQMAELQHKFRQTMAQCVLPPPGYDTVPAWDHRGDETAPAWTHEKETDTIWDDTDDDARYPGLKLSRQLRHTDERGRAAGYAGDDLIGYIVHQMTASGGERSPKKRKGKKKDRCGFFSVFFVRFCVREAKHDALRPLSLCKNAKVQVVTEVLFFLLT